MTMAASDKYEVVCGNIGTVYQGDDETEANRIFDIYVDQSKNSVGSRAEGESVTIFENYGTGTDIIREHDGHLEQNDV
jgi:hypothetical protein